MGLCASKPSIPPITTNMNNNRCCFNSSCCVMIETPRSKTRVETANKIKNIIITK